MADRAGQAPGAGSTARAGGPAQGAGRPLRKHTYKCPMRWSDMDAYGHVNNARYLTYLEEARVDFTDALVAGGATPFLERGVLVAHHEIRYLRPLVYRAAPVPIDVWVTQLGGGSFEVSYEVYDEQDATTPRCTYARARTTIVSYDFAHDRMRRLLPDQRAALESYLVVDGPEWP